MSLDMTDKYYSQTSPANSQKHNDTTEHYTPQKITTLDRPVSSSVMNEKVYLTSPMNPSPTGESEVINLDPGRSPGEVYDNGLVWWAAAIRRRIVKSVEWESGILAAMQDRVRTPWLDRYFVYSSMLGTHTFFMTALPCCFFFGFSELGRGLIFVLAIGVYCSSVIKDLICSPRPFSPPVTRLSIGSHHHEYGFPSTHSTNSVSIALYVWTHVHGAYTDATISYNAYFLACLSLAFYVFTIVYGRLYTGMHSFSDCSLGVLLGTCIWALHISTGEMLDNWLVTSGWSAPLIIIALSLICVNQHPQPVDDCPCFEDAIAFVSVVMGTNLARWHAAHYGYDENTFFTKLMPGSGFETFSDISFWVLFAVIKMVIGVLIIFAWRIVAKPTFQFVLPPIYRLLAHVILPFNLPNRRFYTPATDYDTVPPGKGLSRIPSVIDLPGQMEIEMEVEVGATGAGRRLHVPRDIKSRSGNGNGHGSMARRESSVTERNGELEKYNGGGDGMENDEKIKHYDADVLTKVFVYCGIAMIATSGVPVMFEVLGWGVRFR